MKVGKETENQRPRGYRPQEILIHIVGLLKRVDIDLLKIYQKYCKSNYEKNLFHVFCKGIINISKENCA